MSKLLICVLVISNSSRIFAQFFISSPQRESLIWKNDGDPSLKFSVDVELTYFDNSQIARSGGVAVGMTDSENLADFLQFNSSRRYFNRSEAISSNRPVHLHSTGINFHTVFVQSYAWEWESFNLTNLIRNNDLTIGKTDIYVGFRDYLETTPHYGWAHLRRASTNAGIAFFLVDWAVNPFPGQPIRAGEPPDLPRLTPVMDTTTDPANPTLRVSWPAGFPGVKLQVAGDLTPPVAWQDQELTAERLAVLALPPDGTLFFRLVWAGP
jgi:hypothetical protein